MAKSKSVMGSMRWMAGAKFGAMLISFVSTAVLARLLTPHDFGVMAIVLLVIALSTAIFEGAFGMGLTIKKDIDGDYISTTFWLSILLSAVLVAVLWLASPWLEGFFHMQRLSDLIRLTSLSLVFNAAGNVSYSLLRREERFKAIAIYQVGCALVGAAPVSIGLALMGYGVWALAIGQLAIAALTAAASLFLSRVPVQRLIKLEHVPHVFATSGYLTISQVLNWAALTGSNSVVGRMLGATELGLYSRGWKLLDLVTTVSAGPMSEVLFPAFAKMQDDDARASAALKNALSVAIPFFAVLSALAIAQGAFIVWVSLGTKWTGTVPVMQILFLALVPRCCYKISESVTVAFRRSGSVALRQGLYAAAMIGLSALAAPHGPVFVAVAASGAVTIFYLSSIAYAMRLVKLDLMSVLKIHGVALTLALAIFAADHAVTILLLKVSFPLAHLVGGFVGFGVAVAAFMYLPAAVLGDALTGMRLKAAAKFEAIRLKIFAAGRAN